MQGVSLGKFFLLLGAVGVCFYSAQNQAPLGGDTRRPNIVFVITDDQDVHLSSLDYMPLVRKHLLEKGTYFNKHYCTTAVCCPSRVTLWTGKASHNTNITDVNPPYGKIFKFVNIYQITKCFFFYRWLSKVCYARIQRQLPSCMVTTSRVQHVLHWQTVQCPYS
jgi:hypothetical protein